MTGQLVLGLVIGTTRHKRRGASVADWVSQVGSCHEIDLRVLDLLDFPLPPLDESEPVRRRLRPEHPHTARWSIAVSACDGFVIVTPEYNHSFPGVLKNALDHLHTEWADKAVGFVSYGGYGGVRAVEHLRSVCGQLKMADVRAQPALSLAVDFDDRGRCDPSELQFGRCQDMFGEVIAWAGALRPLRARQGRSRDGALDGVVGRGVVAPGPTVLSPRTQ